MRKVIQVGLVAALLCWAVPGAALAQEHGSASSDPVRVDLWQAGFTVVVFVLLVLILGKFAFKPILKSLQAREDFIRKSIEDAENANKKAQEQLAQYTEQMNRARAEASAVVEEGRRDAEVVKRGIQDESRKEADAIIERAKREVGIARDTAVRELYNLSADLATHMAGKIISKELKLNPADQERLIEESITELGHLGGSEN